MTTSRSLVRAGWPAILLLALLLPAAPASGGGILVVDTGAAGCNLATDELDVFLPQGDDAGTANGDFISSAAPGLDDPYRYYIEVPSGLSQLVIEVFDADIGVGGAAEGLSGECGRDRARGGSFTTSATYELFNPAGTGMTTQFTTGNAAGPTGADNAWLTLYDSNTSTSTAPAFSSSNTAVSSADTTSLTITRPGAASAGDLLIALIVIDGGDGDIAPSGSTWTQLDEGDCSNDACHTAVFWRITTAAEPASFTFDWAGGGSEQAAGGILRYTGVDTANPIDVSSFVPDEDNDPDAPSVTTTVANTRVVRLLGGDNNDFSAHPGGHSGRFAVESTPSGGDDASVTAAAADTTQAAISATGTGEFTLDATQDTRVGTIALRGTAGTAAPANGHWELRLTMNDGDDLNAVGIRAHDGTSGSTELNVYYQAHTQYGVNPPGGLSLTTRDYLEFPYITQGCSAFKDDFDYDSENAGSQGSVTLSSRQEIDGNAGTTGFTAGFADAGTGSQPISNDNVWHRGTFQGWTDDNTADDYGIWRADISISNYQAAGDDGLSGNYSNVAFMTSAAAAPPPGDNNPTASSFRVYLPTDAGGAPAKPYLEQFVRHVSGPNPPLAGQTTRVQVTVRYVNPGAQDVTFSNAASNVITVRFPGDPAPAPTVAYAGGGAVNGGGSIVSQPSTGSTTASNIVWDPGTVPAGATETLTYLLDVTPSAAGQRIVVTGTPASNGTNAVYVDNTGNTSQTRARHTFGPLCELALTSNNLTEALIGGFRAFRGDAGVVVEWESVSEVRTAGYDLYRFDPAQRRWRRVNERPVPAKPGQDLGAVYRLADRGAAPGETLLYRLQEIRLDGQRQSFGPYRVVAREPAERAVLAALIDGVAREERAAPASVWAEARAERAAGLRVETAALAAVGQPAKAAAVAAKVGVRESGLYRVTAAQLAAALGLPEAAVRLAIAEGKVEIKGGGKEVAWLAQAEGAGLLFYGEQIDSIYTRDNVYYLELGKGKGKKMGDGNGGSPAPVAAPLAFRDALHAEEDHLAATVAATDPESDYWHWDYAEAGGAHHAALAFDAPAAAAGGGAARLAVRFRGATSTGVAGEHHALVRLNGTLVGETSWTGAVEHAAQFEAASSLLLEGSNSVVVEAALDAGVPFGLFYVDSVDLDYDKRYVASGDALFLRGAGNRVVTTSGFSGPEILVLGLDQPQRPRLLSGVTVDGTAGNFRASFKPGSATAPFLAVGPEGLKSPSFVRADRESDWKSGRNAAEYVIVTTGELAAAAQDLAGLRVAQGLTMAVVDVEDLYDEFNQGLASPHALAEFVREARRRWRVKPAYLLLAGAGTHDYRDNRGLGGNLVPPLMVSTPSGLFASDQKLGDTSRDDGVPEVAVGRLPVVAAEELAAYADKIAALEGDGGQGWSGNVLLLADDRQVDADFPRQSGEFAARLAAGFAPSDFHVGSAPIESLRAQLFAALDAGASFVNFVGHGGLDRITAEGLLLSGDVPALTNGGRLPVFSAFTCTINRFDVPGVEALGAALVVAPDGGAAAVWAPSALSENLEAQEIGLAYAPQLGVEGLRLGDVVRASLKSYVAANGSSWMPLVYNLLGDPALRLKAAPEPSVPPPPANGPSEE